MLFLKRPSCVLTSPPRTIPCIILVKLFTPDPMVQPRIHKKNNTTTKTPSEGGWSHIRVAQPPLCDHCLRTWTTPRAMAGVYEARGWFLTLPPWPPNPPDHPLFISSQNQA